MLAGRDARATRESPRYGRPSVQSKGEYRKPSTARMNRPSGDVGGTGRGSRSAAPERAQDSWRQQPMRVRHVSEESRGNPYESDANRSEQCHRGDQADDQPEPED